MKKIFASCLLLLVCTSLLGQVRQRKFTLQQLALPAGFPTNTIHTVLTDQTGFIWIFCSNNRFYRFDGQELLPATTLFGNKILRYTSQTPYIDKTNGLWIGDLNNLCRIELHSFIQHNYHVNSGPSVFENSLTGIIGDNHYIYFATVNGQIFRADKDYRFKKMVDLPKPTQPNAAMPVINHLALYDDALYFVVAGHGIWRRGKDGSIAPITLPGTAPEGRSYSWLKKIGSNLLAYDDAGALIAIRGTSSRQVLNRQGGIAGTFYPLDPAYYVSFLDKRMLVQHHIKKTVTIEEFPVKGTLGMLNDTRNELFIRSNTGLYRIGSEQTEALDEFNSFRDINKNNSSIRHIFTFGGQTWLGTYDGLFKMDKDLLQSVKISHEFIYTSIQAPDKKNSILLGTEGSGLMRMDSAGRLEPIISNRDIANPFITSLSYLDNERLIIGTYQGLYIYNFSNKKLQVLKADHDPQQALFSKIRKVYVLADRVIFAGEKGLFWFSKAEPSRINRFKNFPISGPVYDFEVRYPLLWTGTRDSGVVVYDLRRETYRSYSTKNGLPDNAVFNLTVKGDYLICGTGDGMALIHITSGQARAFNKAQGLPSNEFNQGALLVNRDRFFMGTTQGIISFTLNKLLASENLKVQKPVLSSLTITDTQRGGQRTIYNLAVNAGKAIRLSPGERMIALRFGSGHRYSGRDSLFYQLNEQSAWVPINGSSLILTGLQPGINIVSLSSDRLNTFAETTVDIAPYFYETSWFKIVLGCLVAGVLMYYVRFRIRKIKQDHALRTRISSNLHDDIGSILTGISMQADYLLYSSNKDLDTKSYLQQISQSSKEATGSMSDMVWSIDARNDDWNSLLGRMRHYADMMFEAAGIEMTFSASEIPQKGRIKQQRRQDFYLIFKEAVNNVCKHAKASAVDIRMVLTGKQLELLITDNGSGFNTDEAHYGNGLKNIKMRAMSLHGNVSWQSSGAGTSMRLRCEF